MKKPKKLGLLHHIRTNLSLCIIFLEFFFVEFVFASSCQVVGLSVLSFRVSSSVHKFSCRQRTIITTAAIYHHRHHHCHIPPSSSVLPYTTVVVTTAIYHHRNRRYHIPHIRRHHASPSPPPSQIHHQVVFHPLHISATVRVPPDSSPPPVLV